MAICAGKAISYSYYFDSVSYYLGLFCYEIVPFRNRTGG